MKFNEGPLNPRELNESDETKHMRWIEEHKQFVGSGKFDAIPKTEIKVGDIVAIREDNLQYQVYEILGDTILVGYDKPIEVRKKVSKNDVRSGEGYGNAFLAYKGAGHLQVEVDGKKIRGSQNKSGSN